MTELMKEKSELEMERGSEAGHGQVMFIRAELPDLVVEVPLTLGGRVAVHLPLVASSCL